MQTLSDLTGAYKIVVWTITLILLGLTAYRAYKVYYHGSVRYGIKHVSNSLFSRALKTLFGITMFILLLNAPFYIYIGSAFKLIVSGYQNHLLFASVLLITVLEMRNSFSLSQKLLDKTYKKVVLAIIVVLFLPFSVYLSTFIPGMFQYPPKAESITLQLPIKGKWAAFHAGASKLLNYHNQLPSQRYAMDILKVNDKNEFYKGKGDTITDLYTMHRKIYAPAGGTVIRAVDSLPNHPITFAPNDTANPAGNHVVIKSGEEQFIYLAHLNKNTLAVKAGDEVKPGHFIGKLGNSGNTSWPHLHMHIQDKPKLRDTTAIGRPYRFEAMERKRLWGWEMVKDGFLIRNDLFRDSQ